MLKFPVTIHANGLEGYSDYHLGQQMKAFFESRGVEVKVEEKYCKNLFGRSRGTHLISLYTDLVWPYYQYARHGGPKTVLQLQCIGPKVYPTHEYVCYLVTLSGNKMNGIPTAHMHVSPSTERDMTQIARKFFNPAMVGKIMANSQRNFYGIEDGFTVWDKPDVHAMVAPQNRWEAGQKNLPLHMHLSNLLKARCLQQNVPYEHDFLHHPDLKVDELDCADLAREVYTFKTQFMDRPTFKANIGRYGMFLSTSVRESFGLYFVELLKAGVVGIFQDYEWNRLLLPDYPFRGNESELIPMVEWVRDNHAEAREMVRKQVLPHIETTYNEQTYLNRIYDTLVALEGRLSQGGDE